MNWKDDDDFRGALTDFAETLSVLDPYRSDFVIAGGFAAFLYRFADLVARSSRAENAPEAIAALMARFCEKVLK